MIDFKKEALVQARNTFAPPYDFNEIVEEVRGQKIPGQIVISLPGNLGITSVVFMEKQRVLDVEEKIL